MAACLLTREEFARGVTWDDYLDHAAGADLQRKRYREPLDPEFSSSLEAKTGKHHAVIMCEFACPDCAWAVPYLVRLLHTLPDCEVRFFPKDVHPRLMDKLETRGKRSVPKLALLDEEYRLIGTWGPRPAVIQQFVEENVAAGKKPPEWKPTVLKYYRSEGVADLQREFLASW